MNTLIVGVIKWTHNILPLIKDIRLNYIKYIHENMYEISILNRLKMLNVRHARHANSR
jgi:hypothetical protein